jgi:hypothetical protein
MPRTTPLHEEKYIKNAVSERFFIVLSQNEQFSAI